jgi:hypothetical protein
LRGASGHKDAEWKDNCHQKNCINLHSMTFYPAGISGVRIAQEIRKNFPVEFHECFWNEKFRLAGAAGFF